MVNLFHIPKHTISTRHISNLLQDKVVTDFENTIADYVGANYACSLNSATNAIFLSFMYNQPKVVTLPSIIPPVVINATLQSFNTVVFKDDVNWVGGSYILHQYADYKIIDSAQKLEKNQFKHEANPQDLMIFSFYPTKPVGGCDGGLIASDDPAKIEWIRTASNNGMSRSANNWDRVIQFAGWKMYMNSLQAMFAQKSFDELDRKYEKLDIVKNIYNKELGLCNTSHHLCRIFIDDNRRFLDYMKQNGIICGIHYEPCHNHPIYNKTNIHNCPLSELAGKTTASIPYHDKLTKKDIYRIIGLIEKYKRSH